MTDKKKTESFLAPVDPMKPDLMIFVGGIILALTAGFVNVTMLDVFNVPVSHMTGAVSRLGVDIAEKNYHDLHYLALILLFFLSGAIISGAIIGSIRLKPGKRYGVVMILEGVILISASFAWMISAGLSVPLAALACGLQNAMASSYYGLIIRTTHMTGIVTDIGVILGNWLRRKDVRPWRLFLLVSLLLSFIFGSFLAVFIPTLSGTPNLIWAAFVCITSGSVYLAYRLLVLERD